MNFDLPYASRRSPVCAQQMVATSQPLATQAGIAALRAGGNAVDAALASAIALTVVEPNNNGVGSDAFAMVWDGHRLHGLNGSGRAPAAWTPEYFAGRSAMPQRGWDSVTVPGAVSVWGELSQRFGKLPFARLFEDAIRYADAGFPVGPETARFWQAAATELDTEPGFAAHFLPAPGAGEVFRRPELAQTLRTIAAQGPRSLYEGELAERIVTAAAAQGGALTAQDLAAHHADWVTPIAQRYRDVILHELPPNGQGLAAQIALGILAHLPAPPLDTELAAHQHIEAMKVAIRAAFDHFADPAAMTCAPEALLEPGMLGKLAAGIGPRANRVPPQALPISHDTVYLCAADAEGMMVSFIQSNYLGFGSGVVVPGTGIAL
ncbi:MAG: gamma-glutamyltransferase, partial [Pseudomonadota bacterium]